MNKASPDSPSADQHASSGRANPTVVRRGTVSWLTHPPTGTARIESESYGFGALPIALPEHEGIPEKAAPGELLATAYAVMMALALASGLALAGTPANEVVVEAACTLVGPTHDRELSAVDLNVTGRVPGLDAAHFHQAVESARPRCLRSAGAREDLPGELDSHLASV